jgi:5'-3' exonuclease
MGDSGDNIPGIPQIGPKRAEGLVKEFGSAFDIYDAAPFSSKYKYIQSLNEHIDRLLINYELMDLLAYCEEAIGGDNTVQIDSTMSTYI